MPGGCATEGVIVVDPAYPAPQQVSIPSDHMAPPGKCRIWYPDRPSGQQPVDEAAFWRHERWSVDVQDGRGDIALARRGCLVAHRVCQRRGRVGLGPGDAAQRAGAHGTKRCRGYAAPAAHTDPQARAAAGPHAV